MINHYEYITSQNFLNERLGCPPKYSQMYHWYMLTYYVLAKACPACVNEECTRASECKHVCGSARSATCAQECADVYLVHERAICTHASGVSRTASKYLK